MEYAGLSTTGQGNFTEIQNQLADVDGNNLIDAVDATGILSYYAYTSTGGTLAFEEWLSWNKAHEIQQIDGLTYIDGILIANKSYSLPETYNPEMNPETLRQFEVMQTAAANDGINIYFLDGYRSYDYQNQVYNNFVNWYGVEMADISAARAGHSEHQTGLAIDVNTDEYIFEGTPAALWIENHAHEYGFIVRYPKGKEDITGYKYEPWHIRYLGVEKAADVYNSCLTLEEYLGIDSYYH
ncbi:MAG: D-alanyl-D-alanine carboxypeptidase family protein [Ruminococcus sp.]|nr:D-alanyl-D-alanine carboxypeptidase family protein [Ruminococcus sp.]